MEKPSLSKSSGFTHEKTHRGETDTWLTPLPLIQKLGRFDLDPCGYPGHRTASTLVCSPDDGLGTAWFNRVWLNPPYGPATGRWLMRLASHAELGGTGIALVFARTDTKWFQAIADQADAFLFMAGRVRFLRPDGAPADCAAAPSVLIAFGRSEARVLKACGIPGVFFNTAKRP
jgi:hypothetical protein